MSAFEGRVLRTIRHQPLFSQYVSSQTCTVFYTMGLIAHIGLTLSVHFFLQASVWVISYIELQLF